MTEQLLTDYVTTDLIVLLVLATPLIGSFVAGSAKNPRARNILHLFISSLLFFNVINLFTIATKGSVREIMFGESFSGLYFSLFIEPLGIIFALLISFLWLVSNIYFFTWKNSANKERQSRSLALSSIAIFSAIGVAFSGNLITLFIFYNTLVISAYFLIAHSRNTPSSRLYLRSLLIPSICFFLPAILLTFAKTESTEFDVGGIMQGKTGAEFCAFLLLLYVAGISAVAIAPLHRWLIEVTRFAPIQTNIMLCSITVASAGIFAILKIVIYIFGIDFLKQIVAENFLYGGWLVWICGISVLFAAWKAMRAETLRTMATYLAISQSSYAIMAIAIFSPHSTIAATFQFVVLALHNMVLFFSCDSITRATGKEKINSLHGAGKQIPLTFYSFTIASFSIIGLPVFAGFISKYFLLVGSFDAGSYFAALVVLLVTLQNAVCLLPIIYSAFFMNAQTITKKLRLIPTQMEYVNLFLAASLVMLFIFPDKLLWLLSLVAGG